MKFLLLSTLLLVIFLLNDASAEKIRKHKKVRKHRPQAIKLDDENKIEDDPPKSNEAVEIPPEHSDEIIDNRVPLIDPCFNVLCQAGRICQVDESGGPICVCIPTCPVETESRRKVCSNHNETWTSDCAIYQQRCFCANDDAQCKGEQYKHVHIEYYGECREMKDCTKEEMADFPRRMRDWLFNVMRDLADRQELTPHYLEMEKEAENNMTRRWMNAAVWKFCDLDKTADRSVSRHELFPIRAPLMALEHCVAPFLNACDKNDDHKITLHEWAKCLELDEDDIEDRCEDINKDEEEDE